MLRKLSIGGAALLLCLLGSCKSNAAPLLVAHGIDEVMRPRLQKIDGLSNAQIDDIMDMIEELVKDALK